jgi:hypothetical protein
MLSVVGATMLISASEVSVAPAAVMFAPRRMPPSPVELMVRPSPAVIVGTFEKSSTVLAGASPMPTSGEVPTAAPLTVTMPPVCTVTLSTMPTP